MYSYCWFLVGTAPHQLAFVGHRHIFASKSPVFEQMLYGNLPATSDHIRVASFDKACELYYVAKKYMLVHLVGKCSEFLSENMAAINACRAYELGKLYNDERLLQQSMKFIIDETLSVISAPTFVDIQMSTFLDILDQDRLNIHSELDLFDALVRYTEKCGAFVNGCAFSAITFDIDTSGAGNGCGNKTGERVGDELIRKALKKIRFLTLTPQQFANGPRISKMLPEHEVHSILFRIVCPKEQDCPMPEGFTCSREKRFWGYETLSSAFQNILKM